MPCIFSTQVYLRMLCCNTEHARKAKGSILIHCMAGISRSVTLTIAYLMRYFQMPMQTAYQYVKEKRPAISPNLNFMGQLVEFESCEDDKKCECLQLEDYAPSPEQEIMSEKMKARNSNGSSKENTPEASRNTPEASKSASTDQPRFMLKLPAPNKRKNKKKVSPRTSPRILTEDAVDLPKKQGSSDGKTDSDSRDEHPAINSVPAVKSAGGTVPTVLSQLRKGSVEQTIRSFEKLSSTES